MKYDDELATKARAITASSRPKSEWTDEELAIVKKNTEQMLARHREQMAHQASYKQKGVDFASNLLPSMIKKGDKDDKRTGNPDAFLSANLIEGVLEPLIPHSDSDMWDCNMLALQWAVDGLLYTQFVKHIVQHVDYMFDNAPVGKENRYNYLDMDADIWVETDIEDPEAEERSKLNELLGKELGEVEDDSISAEDVKSKEGYSRLVLQNHGHYVYIYRRTSYCCNDYSIRQEYDDDGRPPKHVVRYNDFRDKGYAGDFEVSNLDEYKVNREKGDNLFYYAKEFKYACMYITSAAGSLKYAIDNKELDIEAVK